MYKILLDYDPITTNITDYGGNFIGCINNAQEYIEPTLEVTNNTQGGSEPIGVDAILKLREKKLSLNDIYQLRASNLI